MNIVYPTLPTSALASALAVELEAGGVATTTFGPEPKRLVEAARSETIDHGKPRPSAKKKEEVQGMARAYEWAWSSL